MAKQMITEYLEGEEEKLQKLFNEYRLLSKGANSSSARAALHALLEQVQEHALCEERTYFPLSEKIKAGTDIRAEIDLLRKDHESLFELISMILKKEEEGSTSTEEQEAFHVLLVNHLKKELQVLELNA